LEGNSLEIIARGLPLPMKATGKLAAGRADEVHEAG
jgi:hypothetical protein